MNSREDAIKNWEFRRIVVGKNEEGKSCIVTDKVTNVIQNPGYFHRADLWCTAESPADNTIEGDRSLDQKTREPFPNGTVFRELIIYPDDPNAEKHSEIVKSLHQQVHQKHMPTEEDYKRHPNMHRTDTVDYIAIVKGEMYLMTDTDEMLMKPGDAVVIKGVNHAWSNRSNEPCVTIGAMVDAKEMD